MSGCVNGVVRYNGDMKLVLVLHNIRSIYNVGAILRTAECCGVERVIYSGYTPYAGKGLPHEQAKLKAGIHKTALGAEDLVSNGFVGDIFAELARLKALGYGIVALEQAPTAVRLDALPAKMPEKVVMILGEEVHGIPKQLLGVADMIIEIPQRGRKESLNVSVAASIAIWEMTKAGGGN